MVTFLRICALVLLAPLLACGRDTQVTEPSPLNVILISIDTLRADHLHCYGYERPTSPNIDRFAEEAILFEQLINTGGGTLPVHMSMFTSLPPTVHNVLPENENALPEERITLAEQLREKGFHTAAFTDGGFMSGRFGFAQGFDDFCDQIDCSSIGMPRSFFGDQRGFGRIMPRVYRWLEQRAKRPFFLFIHTYDVHSGIRQLPYDPPPEFRDRFVDPGYSGSFDGCRSGRCASEFLKWLNLEVRQHQAKEILTADEIRYVTALYDGAITYVDHEIGKLLDRLREMELYDPSLIIITSDHGEEFLEHGLMLHHQNYEEIAHVPLIVKLPASQYGGKRVRGLVSTIDLMPTILEVSGIAPNPEVMGESLLPLLAAGDAAGREYVYMAGGLEKLRSEDWSLLVSKRGPVQLYDLVNDPRETTNVIAEHPEIVRRLFQRYRRIRRSQLEFHSKLASSSSASPMKLTAEEVKELTALGYL